MLCVVVVGHSLLNKQKVPYSDQVNSIETVKKQTNAKLTKNYPMICAIFTRLDVTVLKWTEMVVITFYSRHYLHVYLKYLILNRCADDIHEPLRIRMLCVNTPVKYSTLLFSVFFSRCLNWKLFDAQISSINECNAHACVCACTYFVVFFCCCFLALTHLRLAFL